MPIVHLYPDGEDSPLLLADAELGMPAASDAALFGGSQARDLLIPGQQLSQASDSRSALYERHVREANDNRVQDLNNQFLAARREVLSTGPDAYYKRTGVDAIHGADAATANLATLRDELLGQTTNGYQRRQLGRILDAHLAASAAGIVRHTAEQQIVYGHRVAATAIDTSRAEALDDPTQLDNAVLRAEGAARALNVGQPPEVVEAGAREAGASVIADVIGDRLARNDALGVALFQQYGDRLDPRARRTFGAAVETLSNSIDAAAWLRERSVTLRPPAPTGDATLDAVNAAGASTAEPPPVVSSGGALLDPDDGIVGTRRWLAEIDERRRALTALNDQEFAANPARLQANQLAIDADTARGRAAVKAETDGLYADLRRHLTTGGPSGGRALTLPPAPIMSRLTPEQRNAVAGQVNAAVEGRKPATDAQTWYTIRQGLTGDDAGERQRWASASLVPFMGRLSPEDYAELEKQQAVVRDDGAGQRRLQAVTRMADEALRSVGIDPAPRSDAAAGRDAAQAAMFHRALQDELSAFESRGPAPSEAEAYGIVTSLKDTAIKSGWLRVRDASPTVMSDFPSTDESFHEDGAQIAQAEPAEQKPGSRVTVDLGRLRRMREEEEQAAAGTGGSNGAPATEPDPGTPEYQAADEQARRIVAEQAAEESGGQGLTPATEPPPGSPEHQAAEKEPRQATNRQEAGNREADRMITRWLAQQRDGGSVPKLPPVLAEWLSPEERRELEALAVTPDTQTDPDVYKRVLSNLLNYNSQVRLKWAREPLFRYRKFLSAPDFAKLAYLQNRLDPETGQVSGFAPVPADLVPLYDWLSPEPDWDYQTFTAIKRTPDGKDWRFVMPSPARSFLKGMLDLLAVEKTGELTTDALESFMTLHGMGGRGFGPRGDEGTFVAGGKKRTVRPPPGRVAEDGVPSVAKGSGTQRSAKVARSGPGEWRIVNDSMPERAAAYQTQITGRSANENYVVSGVKFDGFSDEILLEAKGPGYAQWVENGRFVDFFDGKKQLHGQALRQVEAANGKPVVWYFAELATANAMRSLLRDERIRGIDIVYMPAKP